jgi:hypothetical protein
MAKQSVANNRIFETEQASLSLSQQCVDNDEVVMVEAALEVVASVAVLVVDYTLKI